MGKDLKEIAAWLNVNKLTFNLLKADKSGLGKESPHLIDINLELSMSNTDVK